METLNKIDLLHCHICSSDLQPQPLYANSGAKMCTRHGDFFIYHERGKDPRVIFRPFEKTIEKTATKKHPSKRSTRSVRSNAYPRRESYTVRCDQTNVIFSSLLEAATTMKINQSDLSQHLRGKRRMVGGYTFTRLVDDGLGRLSPVPRPIIEKPNPKAPIKIRCDQTGVVYESIHEAARLLNLGRGNIYSHLLGLKNRKRVGGYTFSKVTSQEKHGL